MSVYRTLAEQAARHRPPPGAIEKVTRTVEILCPTKTGALAWRLVAISLPRVKFLERGDDAAIDSHLAPLYPAT